MIAFAVRRLADGAFEVATSRGVEAFRRYSTPDGGDFVDAGMARMWTVAGRRKLDRLGICPYAPGTAGPRPNSIFGRAPKPEGAPAPEPKKEPTHGTQRRAGVDGQRRRRRAREDQRNRVFG